MTMNHPDITLYGTDPAAHRRRMVRDLELFLGNALATGTAEAGEHREHDHVDAQPVYSTATLEDPRC
jgi:hypothetical protein